MNAVTIPTFDAESPDVVILETYERVRRARAYGYSFDHLPDRLRPHDELAASDGAMIADEGQVEGNFAATVPGIATRLLLLLPGIDQTRWIDQALCEQGFKAVLPRIKELDGQAQQVAYAIDELHHFAWESVLAAYERSVADFDLALKVKGCAEDEHFATREDNAGKPPAFLERMLGLAEELENRFSNNAQIEHLIKTLAPDWAAYDARPRSS